MQHAIQCTISHLLQESHRLVDRCGRRVRAPAADPGTGADVGDAARRHRAAPDVERQHVRTPRGARGDAAAHLPGGRHPAEVDIYPLNGKARIFDLRVSKPGAGDWDVVAVFNWNTQFTMCSNRIILIHSTHRRQ